MAHNNSASKTFRLLNGLFCVYKERGQPLATVLNEIANALCSDLNELPARRSHLYLSDIVETNSNGELCVVGKRVQKNLADHPLVVGRRYEPIDLHLQAVFDTPPSISGVCPIVIGAAGDGLLSTLREARLDSKYTVETRLGWASNDYTEEGGIMEYSSNRHLSMRRINNVLTNVESSFQRSALRHAGVDPQSNEAFQLASQGPVRPAENSHAIFYRLRCVSFRRPFASFELVCSNENELAIRNAVHEVGLMLRSGAVSRAVTRTRSGIFQLSHALTRDQWTLQNILNNMALCSAELKRNSKTILSDSRSLPSLAATVAVESDGETIATYEDTQKHVNNGHFLAKDMPSSISYADIDLEE